MQTKTSLLLLITAAIAISAFVGVAYAQTPTQTPTQTPNLNSRVPPCVAANTGANAPPCWSNNPNAGIYGATGSCQGLTQGNCWNNGVGIQNQFGNVCGLGAQQRCTK